MGRPSIDLTGQQFGSLLVLKRVASSLEERSMWMCECLLCDDGRVIITRSNTLRRGLKTSCGCDTSQKISEAAKTHGATGTPEHAVWRSMLYRCRTPSSVDYANYGGRGIDFDPRWQSFKAFYADMGPRPSSLHTLDRRDNEAGYWKQNCRWTTRKVQQRNRRSNLTLTLYGVTQTVVWWAELMGLKEYTVKSRLRMGWDPVLALGVPPQKKRRR